MDAEIEFMTLTTEIVTWCNLVKEHPLLFEMKFTKDVMSITVNDSVQMEQLVSISFQWGEELTYQARFGPTRWHGNIRKLTLSECLKSFRRDKLNEIMSNFY